MNVIDCQWRHPGGRYLQRQPRLGAGGHRLAGRAAVAAHSGAGRPWGSLAPGAETLVTELGADARAAGIDRLITLPGAEAAARGLR